MDIADQAAAAPHHGTVEAWVFVSHFHSMSASVQARVYHGWQEIMRHVQEQPSLAGKLLVALHLNSNEPVHDPCVAFLFTLPDNNSGRHVCSRRRTMPWKLRKSPWRRLAARCVWRPRWARCQMHCCGVLLATILTSA